MIREEHIVAILRLVPNYVAFKKLTTDARQLIVEMKQTDERFAMMWRARVVQVPHRTTYLWSVAATAYQLAVTEREISDSDLIDDMVDLLLSKQAKYGPMNLERYGVDGVIIRMSDKIQRLPRLYENVEQGYDDEPYDDTLNDLLGYAVLGLHMTRPI